MATILSDIATSAAAVFGVRSGTEEAPFESLAHLPGGVEIRRYGPRVAVETAMDAANAEAAPGQAFGRLFRYISGANRGPRPVAMTVPVARRSDAGTKVAMTVPVAQGDDGRATMRFFLPAAVTVQSAPEPTDPAVRVVAVPAVTMAVLRFAGRAGAHELSDRKAELLGALMGSAWLALGHPETWFYDPPFTLPWLRRNEVVVQVDPRPAAA